MAARSDNFNRANASPAGAPWVTNGGSGIKIAGNLAQKISPDDCTVYYTGAANTADQYAQAVEVSPGIAGHDWGPATRVGGAGHSSAPEGYLFDNYLWSGSASTGSFAKMVNGSFTTMVSVNAGEVFGDTLRVESDGTAQRCYINGVLKASSTDTSLTGGQPGMFVFDVASGAGGIDNWEGGDLYPEGMVTDIFTGGQASFTGSISNAVGFPGTIAYIARTSDGISGGLTETNICEMITANSQVLSINHIWGHNVEVYYNSPAAVGNSLPSSPFPFLDDFCLVAVTFHENFDGFSPGVYFPFCYVYSFSIGAWICDGENDPANGNGGYDSVLTANDFGDWTTINWGNTNFADGIGTGMLVGGIWDNCFAAGQVHDLLDNFSLDYWKNTADPSSLIQLVRFDAATTMTDHAGLMTEDTGSRFGVTVFADPWEGWRDTLPTAGGGGGSTTPQAITANSTGTPSFLKKPGKKFTISSTGTPTYIRRPNKILSLTSTATSTILKKASKAFSVTSTSTSTLVKQAKKIFANVTSTATSTMVRQAKKVVSVTSTTTSTILKRAAKAISVTSTGTSTVIKKAIKSFSVTGTGTATLVPMRVFLKALSVTVTSILGGGTPPVGSAVRYYAFDEGTGTTAVDSVGAQNGTLDTGASWITGQIGSAVRLDGTVNGTVAMSSSLTLGTVHTVAMWMRWQDTGDGVVIGGVNGEYAFYFDTTNAYYSAGTGNFAQVAHSGLSGWQHWAVVRNGVSVQFYKNGVAQGSVQTLGFGGAGCSVARIGRYDFSGSNFPAQVDLDEVRFYTTALTAIEVAALTSLGGRGMIAQVGKLASVTSASTSTFVRKIGKLTSVTSTATSTLFKQAQKSFNITSTTTSTFVKQAKKIINITSTSTSTFIKNVNKLFSVSSTATTAMLRSARKFINTTLTGTASLATQLGTGLIQKALTVTATGTTSITKRAGKIFAITSTSTSTLLKRANKIITRTSTATTTIAFLAVKPISLVVNAVATSTIKRQVSKIFSSSSTATVSFAKKIGKFFVLTGGAENLIPNPSAEVSLLPYITSAGTIPTLDNTVSLFGSSSVKTTGAGGALDGAQFRGLTTGSSGQYIPYTGTSPVTISAWVKSDTPGMRIDIWLTERDINGTIIGGAIPPFDAIYATITVDGTWQRISATVTPSGTQAGGSIRVTNHSFDTQTFWIDGVMFTLGSTLYNYFDGDNGGTWTGTPYASTSLRNILFPVFTKKINKPFGTSSTATVTLAKIGVKTVVATVTAISTSTIGKKIAKTISFPVIGTSSLLKNIRKSFSATLTGSTTLNAIRARLITLTASVSNTVSFAKRTTKSLSISSTGTPLLFKRLAKVFSVPVTGTASAIRNIGKKLSAAATGTASLTPLQAIFEGVHSTFNLLKNLATRIVRPGTQTISVVDESTTVKATPYVDFISVQDQEIQVTGSGDTYELLTITTTEVVEAVR